MDLTSIVKLSHARRLLLLRASCGDREDDFKEKYEGYWKDMDEILDASRGHPPISLPVLSKGRDSAIYPSSLRLGFDQTEDFCHGLKDISFTGTKLAMDIDLISTEFEAIREGGQVPLAEVEKRLDTLARSIGFEDGLGHLNQYVREESEDVESRPFPDDKVAYETARREEFPQFLAISEITPDDKSFLEDYMGKVAAEEEESDEEESEESSEEESGSDESGSDESGSEESGSDEESEESGSGEDESDEEESDEEESGEDESEEDESDEEIVEQMAQMELKTPKNIKKASSDDRMKRLVKDILSTRAKIPLMQPTPIPRGYSKKKYQKKAPAPYNDAPLRERFMACVNEEKAAMTIQDEVERDSKVAEITSRIASLEEEMVTFTTDAIEHWSTMFELAASRFNNDEAYESEYKMMLEAQTKEAKRAIHSRCKMIAKLHPNLLKLALLAAEGYRSNDQKRDYISSVITQFFQHFTFSNDPNLSRAFYDMIHAKKEPASVVGILEALGIPNNVAVSASNVTKSAQLVLMGAWILYRS